MLSKASSAPAHSAVPGASRKDRVAGPAGNGSQLANPDITPPQPATTDREARRERSRRKAHRTRLHAYAILAVALVAFLVALAASNTAQVRVSWVFGTSRVSLVWLVLFAAILGWLVGLVATAVFHWRTRAPRGRGGTA